MSERVISFSDAIREGLTEAARRDPSVLFFAEGVADPTAVFGTLKGIGDVIGKDRMIEMPVSENGLTGAAVGAALMGHRPVISFHRVEFALLAMDQIVNNAAKMHYSSNGRHTAPIVLRLIVGRGWGQGPNHSQSLESVFAHFPGLKVVSPTYPADAWGLIMGSVADDNPVVFIEHRWCHYVTEQLKATPEPAPLDGPKCLREGRDVTIVASAYMTLEAMLAAECLKAGGIAAEVVDLRVIRPLVMAPIRASVQKTGRLLTVDAGWRSFGVGAEIVAQVVSEQFERLRYPPVRLGLPDHPTPSSRGLVEGYYPDARQIVDAVAGMLGMTEADLEPVRRELDAALAGRKVDQPAPAFKGPF